MRINSSLRITSLYITVIRKNNPNLPHKILQQTPHHHQTPIWIQGQPPNKRQHLHHRPKSPRRLQQKQKSQMEIRCHIFRYSISL